jgi:hypothetical protein
MRRSGRQACHGRANRPPEATSGTTPGPRTGGGRDLAVDGELGVYATAPDWSLKESPFGRVYVLGRAVPPPSRASRKPR